MTSNVITHVSHPAVTVCRVTVTRQPGLTHSALSVNATLRQSNAKHITSTHRRKAVSQSTGVHVSSGAVCCQRVCVQSTGVHVSSVAVCCQRVRRGSTPLCTPSADVSRSATPHSPLHSQSLVYTDHKAICYDNAAFL